MPAAVAALPERCAAFLAAVDARPSGEGRWRALCPCHQSDRYPGREPSLSVGVGDRGLLLKCHAGCEFLAVVRAAGFRPLDLAWEPAKLQGKWEPPARRVPVKWYEYQDENRNPLYRKVRYEPKGFSQEWHDEAAGKWRVGLPPHVPRVLYRLPELLAEPGRVVVYAEGEKDADNLAALGFVATTHTDGAGNWKDCYAQSLRGRSVAVIPDRDPPGLRHADQVVGSLVRHGAREVRLVTLPGGAKDFSEWLERQAGGDVAAAARAVLGVPAWGPKGV
jgi:putative DNA primase/helicase